MLLLSYLASLDNKHRTWLLKFISRYRNNYYQALESYLSKTGIHIALYLSLRVLEENCIQSRLGFINVWKIKYEKIKGNKRNWQHICYLLCTQKDIFPLHLCKYITIQRGKLEIIMVGTIYKKAQVKKISYSPISNLKQ